MINPTKQERDKMFANATQLLIGMMDERRLPSTRQLGDAITSNLSATALECRGSVRQAAQMVGTPPSKFLHGLLRGLPEEYHEFLTHDPLDDALFPFIRVRWDSSDLGFVEQYCDWLANKLDIIAKGSLRCANINRRGSLPSPARE